MLLGFVFWVSVSEHRSQHQVQLRSDYRLETSLGFSLCPLWAGRPQRGWFLAGLEGLR